MNPDNLRRFVAASEAILEGERGPGTLASLGWEVLRDARRACLLAIEEKPLRTCPACGSCTVQECPWGERGH